MTDPAGHDPQALLASWWARSATRNGTWPGLAPAAVRAGPAEAGATADREAAAPLASRRPWRLGLVAACRGADAPAIAGWDGAAGHTTDTAHICAVLRSWEDRFGARVVGLGFAELFLSVAAPPATADEALPVAAEHAAFYPAMLAGPRGRQQPAGSLSDHAAALVGSPAWHFPVALIRLPAAYRRRLPAWRRVHAHAPHSPPPHSPPPARLAPCPRTRTALIAAALVAAALTAAACPPGAVSTHTHRTHRRRTHRRCPPGSRCCATATPRTLRISRRAQHHDTPHPAGAAAHGQDGSCSCKTHGGMAPPNDDLDGGRTRAQGPGVASPRHGTHRNHATTAARPKAARKRKPSRSPACRRPTAAHTCRATDDRDAAAGSGC
jgi:hypothetical protein